LIAVLGELSSFQSLLSNQLPVVKLVDFDGSTVRENVKKTSKRLLSTTC
jgi:hypothetical protein